MQKNKVGWKAIFSLHKFAGSGACKPQQEFKGSVLKPFFNVVLILHGALIVYLRYHIKASQTLMAFEFGT